MVCWVKRMIRRYYIYHPITIYSPNYRINREIFYQKFIYHSERFKYVRAIHRDVVFLIDFRV